MKVIETNLKDCFILKPTVFEDERGFFFESFNHQKLEELTGISFDSFIQENQSVSKKGVIRGLHLQKGEFAQTKIVRVLQGAILDVVVDVRPKSITFGALFSCILSAGNNKQLVVPKGFLHGFSVLENDTIVSYKCDNYYHKNSEDGVCYNDKDLNINWELRKEEIIISKKDRKLKTFKEFIQ